MDSSFNNSATSDKRHSKKNNIIRLSPRNNPSTEQASDIDIDEADEQDSELSPDYDYNVDWEEEDNEPKEFPNNLAWAITGLSILLIIAGFLFLYSLYSPTPQPDNLIITTTKSVIEKPPPQTHKEPQHASKPIIASDQNVVSLSPFLIPTYSGGELVFCMAKVLLVVPDAQTKNTILEQTAKIRNIIYQNLKGTELQSNGHNSLKIDKQRLLKELNKMVAPLEITDIQLTATLMKT